jgi:hypothetical protein
MERGPLALFGAIIAVGLGPAMWLGAQFGNATDVPTSPPAVRSEHNPDQNQDKGGAAGSAPQDPAVIVDTTPRANIKPLDDTPTARPSSSPSRKPRGKPSASPSASSPTPSPSDDSTPPPTESTDPADPPPGDGTGGGPVQPSPPAGSDQGSGAGLHLTA